jgi:hypothetical protein
MTVPYVCLYEEKYKHYIHPQIHTNNSTDPCVGHRFRGRLKFRETNTVEVLFSIRQASFVIIVMDGNNAVVECLPDSCPMMMCTELC